MATFQTLQDPFNQTSLNGSLWGSSVDTTIPWWQNRRLRFQPS